MERTVSHFPGPSVYAPRRTLKLCCLRTLVPLIVWVVPLADTMLKASPFISPNSLDPPTTLYSGLQGHTTPFRGTSKVLE